MYENKPNSVEGKMGSPKVSVSNSNGANKIPPQQSLEELEKLKAKLENFKKAIVKKYGFTMSLSLLPAPSYFLFEEDENMPKEVVETKPVHVMMLIPEDEYKNVPKIKPEVVKLVKETGENLWIHIKTPVDLWNYGLDSKFEFLDAVAASFPLHDAGFLGSLRVSNIHKSLVLRKFEKYVASYVIGGSLVRGVATKDSDIDCFVIIDDTDVKKMSRIDLLDRLRGIIYDYIREATALAGVTNKLEVQVYLLTDFWQSVKDAHPVMFTFIRDGIPFYDRGTFIPWKLLLKMGRIKPSPEAVDLYMKEGDRTEEMVKRRLLDAMIDTYYGVLTPTQALLMLYGLPPPTHKETPKVFREVFREKEKMVDEKFVKILERGVDMFRQYEYGKLKEVSGAEIDKLMKDCQDYNKMLKALRGKIESRMQEKSVEQLHSELFKLLKNIFGEKSPQALLKEMESALIKKGKLQPRMLSVAKKIFSLTKKENKEKSQSETQRIVGEASELMDALVEYSQRKDIVKAERGIIQISYSGRKAEVVLADKDIFIVEVGTIKKLSNGKMTDSNKKEFEEAISKTKDKLEMKINSSVLNQLKESLGDFEILL